MNSRFSFPDREREYGDTEIPDSYCPWICVDCLEEFLSLVDLEVHPVYKHSPICHRCNELRSMPLPELGDIEYFEKEDMHGWRVCFCDGRIMEHYVLLGHSLQTKQEFLAEAIETWYGLGPIP